jgi:general secretion pathway protein G
VGSEILGRIFGLVEHFQIGKAQQTLMPSAQHVVTQFEIVARSSQTPLALTRGRRRTLHGSRGFSLIELLIVVGIIMIIAALAVPHLLSVLDEAKVTRAVGDIHAIEVNIAIFQATSAGTLPTDLSQIEATSLIDPWGHPYQYFNHASGTGNGGMLRQDLFLVALNEDYDLYSLGKDGQTTAAIGTSVSQDDIVRAATGAYTGLASQF